MNSTILKALSGAKNCENESEVLLPVAVVTACCIQSKACDWTTGRKRSYSNSSQLTEVERGLLYHIYGNR